MRTVVATAAARHADRLRSLGAEQVVDSHAGDWAAGVEPGFDAVLVAVTGTADQAVGLLRDGGSLCSITSDAPAGERGITSTDLYVRPDAGQLARLAADAAEGRLVLETRAVPLEAAVPFAQQVIARGSGSPEVRPRDPRQPCRLLSRRARCTVTSASTSTSSGSTRRMRANACSRCGAGSSR